MRRSKREALSTSNLGLAMEKLEHMKVRVRAEHPFHVVKKLFHHQARYRGLKKNTAQLFTLFGFANFVLAGRQFEVAESRAPS